MSKVALLGFPFFSHFNQTIGLVEELVGMGEQIHYFSTEEYKNRIENLGAVFCHYRTMEKRDNVAEAETILEKVKNKPQQDYHNLNLIQVFESNIQGYQNEANEVINDIFDEVVKIAPDYIICDQGVVWGKQIARKLGLHAVSYSSRLTYCHRIFEKDLDYMYKYVFFLPDEIIHNPANRDILNLYSRRFAGLLATSLNIVWLSKEFHIYSELFDDTFKFVGPPIYPRKEFMDFPLERLEGKPVVYISLGSILSNNEYYLDFYQECFTAFQDMEFTFVLNIGKMNVSRLKNIPGNFIICNYAPQLEVLKRSSAFITHGGISSISEGLYYNVPLIVIPQALDQFLNAKCVQYQEAGIWLDSEPVKAAELKETLGKLLTEPKYKANCKRIGESHKNAGGYKQAVKEIVRFKQAKGIK